LNFSKKLGFEESGTSSGTASTKKLVYTKSEFTNLKNALDLLGKELVSLLIFNVKNLKEGKKEDAKEEIVQTSGSVSDDIYLPKKKWSTRTKKQAQERTRRRSAAEMAAIAEKRLKGEKVIEGKITQGRIGNLNHLKRIRESIKQIRETKHNKWRNTNAGRKRVFTVSDLEKLRQEDNDTTAKFGSGTMAGSSFAELTAIGKQALKFTNDFRQQNGLPALSWHQTLAEIGYVHSKNMGDGKAKFSHDGFHDRVAKYPFPSRSAAENLAMNHGLENVARVAVDGWIESPGHRKNLLSNHNHCGIGVYRNSSGAFYLTQLFGLG